jgi:glutathione S-transferase
MLELTYWPKRGRAEQVRLLMALLELDWEEHNFDQGSPAHLAMQALGPAGGLMFGSVPLLEDGAFQLVQGPVILGYLARKHGLVDPTDLQAGARADAIAWGAEDLRIAYFLLFGAGAARKQRVFLTGRFRNRWLPSFDGLLERGFFVGDGYTQADVAVWDVLDSLVTWVPGSREALAEHARLLQWFDAFAAHPPIASYLASSRRPQD